MRTFEYIALTVVMAVLVIWAASAVGSAVSASFERTANALATANEGGR